MYLYFVGSVVQQLYKVNCSTCVR